LGNAASPLRKALVDSKLGEELTNSGYADYQRDTYFTVGLKGSEPERLDAMAKLIVDVCQREIDKGLDPEAVGAAFHKMELATRQIGGMYPLRLMGRVYDSWMYDGDPLYHLRINHHLAQLRAQVKQDPAFLATLLQEMIVRNRHVTLTAFVPD